MDFGKGCRLNKYLENRLAVWFQTANAAIHSIFDGCERLEIYPSSQKLTYQPDGTELWINLEKNQRKVHYPTRTRFLSFHLLACYA